MEFFFQIIHFCSDKYNVTDIEEVRVIFTGSRTAEEGGWTTVTDRSSRNTDEGNRATYEGSRTTDEGIVGPQTRVVGPQNRGVGRQMWVVGPQTRVIFTKNYN